MHSHRRTLLIRLSLLCLLALFVVACGGDEEPTPTPTKTAVTQNAAQPAPTDTPQPAAPPAEAATPVPPPAQTTITRVTIDATELNMRSGPGTNFDVVRSVAQGQQFDLVARSDDQTWLQIGENGQAVGWVAAEFVTTAETVAEVRSETAASPATGATVNYLPASMDSPAYGAQAFLWWRPEVTDRDLMLMKEAGFDWVKQSFAWETIEGAGKDVYDWTIADRVVTAVNKDGLKLLARLSSDPDLANFWAGHAPGNADNFADFARAVAQRYNCTPQATGCIQAFQIWNEPESGPRMGQQSP